MCTYTYIYAHIFLFIYVFWIYCLDHTLDMLTVRHNELFGSLLAYLLPVTQTSLRIVSSDNTDTIHHIATLLSVAFLLPTPTVAFALSQSIMACFAAENAHARSENVRRGLENLGRGGNKVQNLIMHVFCVELNTCKNSN